MFSNDAFVQYVFANKLDVYYCDSLLKLNLEQYLWLSLHEKYDVVYYLQLLNGEIIVKSYGDINAEKYKNKSSFKSSNKKRFCNWMNQQLSIRNNKKSAFVIHIEDISCIYDNSSWAKLFGSIVDNNQRSGTIVVVLPTVAVKARDALLNCKWLLDINEPVIVNAQKSIVKDFFSYLKKNKGESCIFLNSFTKERVRSMMICFFSENVHGYFPSKERIETITDYMVQYLNNSQLRWHDRIFDKHFDDVNVMYCNVYEQLKKPDVFKRLCGIIDRIEKNGGFREYLTKYSISIKNEEQFYVRLSYENCSYSWKCLMLYPLECNKKDYSLDIDADTMLLDIQRELSMLRTYEENKFISDEILGFLNKIENAVSEGDIGTYSRGLFSVRFLIQCIYTNEDMGNEVLKIIDRLKVYINLSEWIHEHKKNIMFYNNSNSVSTDKLMSASDNMVKINEMRIRKLDSIIPVSISSWFNCLSQNEEDLCEAISNLLSELDDKLKDNKEEKHDEDLNTIDEYEDEIMISDESFYGFRPPTISTK